MVGDDRIIARLEKELHETNEKINELRTKSDRLNREIKEVRRDSAHLEVIGKGEWIMYQLEHNVKPSKIAGRLGISRARVDQLTKRAEMEQFRYIVWWVHLLPHLKSIVESKEVGKNK